MANLKIDSKPLGHSRFVDQHNNLRFKANSGYFTFLKNLVESLSTSDLDRVAQGWRIVYKYVFESKEIDYQVLKADLDEMSETIRESDSWDLGFKFLVYSYVYYIKTREEKYLSVAIDFCKHYSYFLRVRLGNVVIHQPDVAFAYGLVKENLPDEAIKEIEHLVDLPNFETHIYLVYYYFGLVVSAFKENLRYNVPNNIIAISYNLIQRDDIPLQDAMISTILSSGDVSKSFERLLEEYFDGSSFLSYYFWERYGKTSTKLQSNSQNPSYVYKMILSLRILGLDRLQYVSDNLSRTIQEIAKYKLSPVIASRAYLTLAFFGIFAFGAILSYFVYVSYISWLAILSISISALLLPNLPLILKKVKNHVLS